MTVARPGVAVVGGGAWGARPAVLGARSEPVALLCHSVETATRLQEERRNERRLPGVALPERVVPTADPAELDGAELVIVAGPSSHLRETMTRIAPRVPRSADVLSVVKGLEPATLLPLTPV